ncbi:HNH endonuclease [Leptospira sp. WS92.C1]
MYDSHEFTERYNAVIGYWIPGGLINEKPQYVLHEIPGKCRFCNLEIPNTTFKKIAHPIPEFLGNRQYLTKSECDRCNEYFDKNLENHFANYLGLERTLTGTKGKKGIPTFKQKDKKFFVREEGDKKMSVGIDTSSDNVKIDTEKNTIEFTAIRPPYVPYAVFKCLVKIGFSLLPQEFTTKIESTRRFLIDPELDNDGGIFVPHIYSYYIQNASDNIVIEIFQRKDVYEKTIPFLIIRVFLRYHFFQSSIPNFEFDNQELGMNVLHPGIEITKPEILDLYGKAVVKDSIQKQTMRFESFQSEVPLEQNRLLKSLKNIKNE